MDWPAPLQAIAEEWRTMRAEDRDLVVHALRNTRDQIEDNPGKRRAFELAKQAIDCLADKPIITRRARRQVNGHLFGYIDCRKCEGMGVDMSEECDGMVPICSCIQPATPEFVVDQIAEALGIDTGTIHENKFSDAIAVARRALNNG